MSSTAFKWGGAVFFLVAAVYLFLHLFMWPAVPIVHEGDHMYFIQDAWRMYRGETIYRDFFEYTFPGTQLVYLGMMYLFGTKFWFINAVIFLQALLQALLGVAISRRIFGDNWYCYLPSALFLFAGFRWFGLDGSHRMLSPIFIWTAVLVLLKSRSYARLALAGALFAGASFFTQPRGMAAACATGLFLAVEAWRERSGWKRLLASEAVLGGTFVLALLGLILPFAIAAGPERFIDYTVFFLRDYVKEPTANYGAYLLVFRQMMEQGLTITAVSVFYYVLIPWVFLVALAVMWRKGMQLQVLLVTLVGLGLAAGTFAPTPLRLYQICLAALIVLAWVVYSILPERKWVPRAVVILLMAGGVVSAVRMQTAWDRSDLLTPTGRVSFISPTTMERYQWLTDNSRAGEDVFEVYQTAVNYMLQLPNPTQVTFLLDNGYTPQWQVDLAVENLRQKKPRLIIWDGNWSKASSARAPDDHLSPLYAYLSENYEIRKSFTPYVGRKMEAWERKQ